MVEDRIAFLEELIKFYRASVVGTAESVDTLAKIEKEFPDNYRKLREITLDPMNIEELLTSMPEKEKETFLLMFTKANIISRSLMKLFDLTYEDKIKLAKTINEFADFTTNKLKELEKSEKEG